METKPDNISMSKKEKVINKNKAQLYKWGKVCLICFSMLGLCALVFIIVQLLNVLATPVAIII